SGAPRRGHVELSDAELRVATLAARGYTNRQIADKLFITVSTVEQHLTRAYRKLAVQRRADLAGKLTPGGAPDGAGAPCGGSTCDQLNAV
ncbi:helix-turn-helix transcriptional regulator, partial [Streptomyces sp. SID5475]|nr:helix-turn-helix transcriptional regulator [Streptomyces sp. SID5475]